MLRVATRGLTGLLGDEMSVVGRAGRNWSSKFHLLVRRARIRCFRNLVTSAGVGCVALVCWDWLEEDGVAA